MGTPVQQQRPQQQQQQYQNPQQQQNMQQRMQNFNNTSDSTNQFDQADIEQNKMLSLFAYIGILFLIPLLAAPNSRYARFHANQGIVLFIAQIVISIGLGIIGMILGAILVAAWLFALAGIVSTIIGLLMWIPSLVLSILGIVNAVGGKAKDLPLIGKIRILK